MADLILKDDSVTGDRGFYECPECNKMLYVGGQFFHIFGCSKGGSDDRRSRYDGMIYHVGPTCPEYADAAEDLKAAAFNLGYDAYPEGDKFLFGRSGQVAGWFMAGWETAENHKDPWVCEICAVKFDEEVDLLAHQFNSPCGEEIKERHGDE